MMPGEFFIGPIGPVEMICILGAMTNFLFIMLGLAVRRQAGPTTLDLGQTSLGKLWEGGLFFVVALSLIVPAVRFGPDHPDFVGFLVVRTLPVTMLLISILVAHATGVRPGRREFAERGLIQGGWRFSTWEDLTDHRWQEGNNPFLELQFERRKVGVPVPDAHTVDVDRFMRHVAAVVRRTAQGGASA